MAQTMIDILLVEDNPTHAEMTVRVLRKHNIANRIEVARDGAEAVDFLFTNHTDADGGPKLVLLDLKLPKLDGIEVLRRIKSDERTRTIPVVMLTSSEEEQDLRTCYALGVNSYVVKPVDFGQFTDAVRTLGLYWVLINHRPD
jgi:two-component system, response regulator